MEGQPITTEEILETLSPAEKEEVLMQDFKVPLEHCLVGYNRNQLLFPRDLMLLKLRELARHRADVKMAITRNPDILHGNINPVFIIGLPRSGTTMLHRLMASDPQFLAPMLWELIEPVPPGRPENFRESERFKKAQNDIEFALPDVVADFFQRRHVLQWELPEECFTATRPYFLNFNEAVSVLDHPEYRDYKYNFPETQATNTYEYYKKCLQCIFYGSLEQDVNIVLKSPIHCLYLKTIQKVFPNAKFIFPYRNAKTMVASFCALIYGMWNLTTASEDKLGVGKRILELYKITSERAIKFFKEAPEDSYIAVPYTEMVTNPLETVKQIYSHFNWDLPPKTVELMQSHHKENHQHKLGKYEYRAEDFGITDDVIRENMKDYLDNFANRSEKLLRNIFICLNAKLNKV